ncbi:hypothetical protein [Deinococcus apachensis]|uniref:hypothetical protein n=1 Tax=Deinococcus apachensis TaxID=309886 RepID=UPI0012F90678|nr:hypothetical protein [Deinococcus apachensis]
MTNYQVSVDRIVVIDEFEKDELFVMGHLVFTPRQAEMAVRRWTKLQQEIKGRLLQRGLPLDPRLEGDRLPEIHAEWLVQSGKYYRWPGAKNKDYWREHLDWLAEAMRIVRHVGPTVHYGHHVNYKEREIERLKKSGLWDDRETIEACGYKAYNELISILCNPYAKGLSLTLASMERMFSHRGLSYEVICDNYDYCKGFSTLEVFEELKNKGVAQSAFAPKFLSSEDEQLIQMTDVVTYAGGQVAWLNLKRQQDARFMPNIKVDRVTQDHQKYVLALDGESSSSPPPRGSEVDALSRPIYLDIVSSFVKHAPELYASLQARRDSRIQELLHLALNSDSPK